MTTAQTYSRLNANLHPSGGTPVHAVIPNTRPDHSPHTYQIFILLIFCDDQDAQRIVGKAFKIHSIFNGILKFPFPILDVQDEDSK